jgi:hypothetical protein
VRAKEAPRWLQAFQALPYDTAARLLAPLHLLEAFRLPPPLLRGYLRNHAVSITCLSPALTAREACQLACNFHLCPTLRALHLRVRHPEYDPLAKRIAPNPVASPGGVELLCASLPFLRHLQSLDLSDCQAGPEGTLALAALLYTLPTLTHLGFASNRAGSALPDLVAELSSLSSLATLDLSCNDGSYGAWAHLAHTVALMPSLSCLVYGDGQECEHHTENALTDDAGFISADVHPLTALPGLQQIQLSGVRRWWPPTATFCLHPQLRRLELLGGALDVRPTTNLFMALSSASSLQFLQLTLGRVCDGSLLTPKLINAEMIALADAVGSVTWPALTHLTLDNSENQDISDTVLKQLHAIESLHELHLVLRLQPAGVLDPDVLCKHTALQQLKMTLRKQVPAACMEDSQLAAASLFAAASKLSHLTSLHLSSPQILEDEDGQLARHLRDCVALLDVSLDCHIGCELMDGLMHLGSQLQQLHIKGLDLGEDAVVRSSHVNAQHDSCSEEPPRMMPSVHGCTGVFAGVLQCLEQRAL